MDIRDAQIAVGRMYRAKEALAGFEPDVEPRTWPKVTAGAEALLEVERALGFALPEGRRRYYEVFDKWDGLRFDNVILGVRDLVGGADFRDGRERRGRIEALEAAELGHARDEWLVVGFNRVDRDLVLVHPISGETAWLAGGIVERYTDFLGYLQHEAEIAEGHVAEWLKQREGHTP